MGVKARLEQNQKRISKIKGTLKKKKILNYIPRPEFPGGQKAMNAFIGKHLRYPQKANNPMISGTVALKIFIDHRGKVTDCKVSKSLGPEFDNEAIRVAKLLEFNVPKIHKLHLGFSKHINFHFKADSLRAPEKKNSAVTSVNYTVRTSEQSHPGATNSFQYTIQWGSPTEKPKPHSIGENT